MTTKEILVELRKIRANIPLTLGMNARKMIGELIERIESLERRKK